jgi:predicted DNA-binding protein (MmcQ/YjbR family)
VIFCTAATDGSSLTLKADPLEREALLVQGDPFFIPAYVGTKGWVGIRADHPETSWEEVAELIATSYCLVAPKRLAGQVVSPPSLDG